jgi:dipeptidyl aminopeptidase/acylaminoacyl peptidase
MKRLTMQRPETASSATRQLVLALLLLAGIVSTAIADAGESLEKFVPSPAQLRGDGDRNRGGRRTVDKLRIEPHWLDGDTRFWYRNDLAGGLREFVLVDCERGTRTAAFDHERLAQALSEAGVPGAAADRLPIEDLQFDLAKNALAFRAGGTTWRVDLARYELTAGAVLANEERPGMSGDLPRRSDHTGRQSELTFVNSTDRGLRLFWLDSAGRRQSYGELAAGAIKQQHTYGGHVWEVADDAGRVLAVFVAQDSPSRAEVPADARPIERRKTPPAEPRRPRSLGSSRGQRGGSPDGQWTAFVRDRNLFVRSRVDGIEVQLSTDGVEGNAYDLIEWSPDSSVLVAFRVEPGGRQEVHLIESSPEGGGRARLQSRPYPLPGDKFTSYELRLFDPVSQREIECNTERIDFGRPRLRWNDDGETFSYENIDRGHQRFRLIEVDARSGTTRHLIDERTETFLWTAHTGSLGIRHVTWLGQTNEIVYLSERDGWRHLYLIDAGTGTIKNQITRGEWVVRGVDRIDEERRQIWFRAGGFYPDQDPYHVHYFRVDFDGSDLVALTEGDGTHTIQFSPDRAHLIDTYSRVDALPRHELRRVADGTLVCTLEEADISAHVARGWPPPEVFTAKGRDGETEIWGIIYRPSDFDPTKRYPVIEHIYAGPHGHHVPKSFSPWRRFAELTDLGFIVVQIDGMGTAGRSKAFHDVCWKNLKDAGLPDRILWHKAVAEKYPWYDVERVGIYGISAGGQNATAAVLFHGDFYKAAVSGCGCHDNRMDKASCHLDDAPGQLFHHSLNCRHWLSRKSRWLVLSRSVSLKCHEYSSCPSSTMSCL